MGMGIILPSKSSLLNRMGCWWRFGCLESSMSWVRSPWLSSKSSSWGVKVSTGIPQSCPWTSPLVHWDRKFHRWWEFQSRLGSNKSLGMVEISPISVDPLVGGNRPNSSRERVLGTSFCNWTPQERWMYWHGRPRLKNPRSSQIFQLNGWGMSVPLLYRTPVVYSKTFAKCSDQGSADDMYTCLTRLSLDIWRTVGAEINRFWTVRSIGPKDLPRDGSY